MGKKSKYIFAKLSSIDNYKGWIKEIIFTIKDLEFWRYVDSTIVKLVFFYSNSKKRNIDNICEGKIKDSR